MPDKRMTCTIATVLIVCGIFCVLGIAILPLLQYIREQSRRTECSDRLRETAFAMHTFHDSNKRLPPGTLGHADVVDFYADWIVSSSEFYWGRAQQTSFLALVLPFQELNSLYDPWAPAATDMYHFLDELEYVWFGAVPGSTTVAFSKLPSKYCPADDIQDASIRVVCATQPVMVGSPENDAMGTLYWPDQDYSSNFGRTNFAACAGAYSGGRHPDPSRRPFAGVMSSRERITLESINDGTAYSIMIGETVGGIDAGVRKSGSSWCFGGLARGRGGIAWMQDPSDYSDAEGRPLTMLGSAQNSSLVGFGSMHVAGVNIARADCSTEVMSRKVDWKVIYSLSGTSDGELDIDY